MVQEAPDFQIGRLLLFDTTKTAGSFKSSLLANNANAADYFGTDESILKRFFFYWTKWHTSRVDVAGQEPIAVYTAEEAS